VHSRLLEDHIDLVLVHRLPPPDFTGAGHPLESRPSMILAGFPSFEGVLKVAEPLVLAVG